MPRPKKPRFVSGYPTLTAFIPQGVPISGEVLLSVEELEAVRLSDFEGLDQESAANLVEVSRQTYGRILARARHCISEALITGKALKIQGGDYEFRGMGGVAAEAAEDAVAKDAVHSAMRVRIRVLRAWCKKLLTERCAKFSTWPNQITINE